MVFKTISMDLEGFMLAKPVIIKDGPDSLKIIRKVRLTDNVINELRRSGCQGVYVDSEGPVEPAEPLNSMLVRRISFFLDKRYSLCDKRDVYERLSVVVEYIAGYIYNDISLLSVMMDLLSYDAYTYGHCFNVAALSMIIGLGIALSDMELGTLGMAGILHDIGKENVPLQIITKPGRLNEQEYELVKEHPIIGFGIARRHELPIDICLGILGHHEKYDGRGYPYGLLGENIPLYARILSIADVFDALTHRRSYHAPLSVEEALGIMEKENAFDEYLFNILKRAVW